MTTLEDFLRDSYATAPSNAAAALIGHGVVTLNLENRSIAEKIHWGHNDWDTSEKLVDMWMKGIDLTLPSAPLAIPIKTSWLGPDELKEVRAASHPPWTDNNEVTALPAIHFIWSSIPWLGLRPYGGTIRGGAITKARAKLRTSLAEIKDQISEWEGIAKRVEEDTREDDDAYIDEKDKNAHAKVQKLKGDQERIAAVATAVTHWPVALYDLDTINSLSKSVRHNLEAYLGRRTSESFAAATECDIQARVLTKLMYELDEQCTAMASEHRAVHEAGLWERGHEYAFDLGPLMVKAAKVDVDPIVSFAQAKILEDVEYRLRDASSRVACGFMAACLGDPALHTMSWMGLERNSELCGYLSTFITSMIPNLVAITSPDTTQFIRYLTLSDVSARRQWREQWFYYQPGNILLWTPKVMFLVDQCFCDAFVVNGETTESFGDYNSEDYRSRFQDYRSLVVNALSRYWGGSIDGQQLESILARLDWYLSPDGFSLHYFLPLPSAFAIWAIPDRFVPCATGLKELHRGLNPLPHYTRERLDFATAALRGLFGSSQMRTMGFAERGRAHLEMVSFAFLHGGKNGLLSKLGAAVKHSRLQMEEQLAGTDARSLSQTDHRIGQSTIAGDRDSLLWNGIRSSIARLRSSSNGKTMGSRTERPRQSEHALTAAERTAVHAALQISGTSIENIESIRFDRVCGALADFVLFSRGPGPKMYASSPDAMQLRGLLVDLLTKYTVNNERFQFVDGIQPPPLTSQAQDDVVRMLLTQFNTAFASIRWDDYGQLASHHVDQIRAHGLNLLQDISSTVADRNDLPQSAYIAAPRGVLPTSQLLPGYGSNLHLTERRKTLTYRPQPSPST